MRPMYAQTLPGIPTLVHAVGIPAKLLKRDKGVYKVISVPKSAMPPPLLKVRKVVIIAGVPQMGNVAIAIEARRWLERVYHVYFITRKPYSDYLTQLASQGVKEIIVYQIVPTSEEGT